jgi:hypothetical protein
VSTEASSTPYHNFAVGTAHPHHHLNAPALRSRRTAGPAPSMREHTTSPSTTAQSQARAWLGAAPGFVVDMDGVVRASIEAGQPLTSPSIAIALPDRRGQAAVAISLRSNPTDVECRVGVGQVRGDVPLRVLGHAELLVRTLTQDLPESVRPTRLVIFASGAKLRTEPSQQDLVGAAALAVCVRLAGLRTPLTLTASSSDTEVHVTLGGDNRVSEDLLAWINRAGSSGASKISPLQYAIEHSAPSMFGDIASTRDDPVRVTLGGVPEARFWAVRQAVRAICAHENIPLAPAFGVIVKSVRVPWYHVQGGEPLLGEALASSAEAALATETLLGVANPARGGNAGLKAESTGTKRLLTRLLAERDGAMPPLVENLGIALRSPSVMKDLLVSLGIDCTDFAQEMMS